MKGNPFLKKSIIIIVLLFNQTIFSQLDGRFGVSLSGNNYITDTNFLFTKSKPGYGVSLIGTAIFSEKFELMMELNYSRNFMTILGRADYYEKPEELKFNLDKFNIPILINYNFLNLNDDWYFGVELGPSISLMNNFILLDESKEDYLIDPYYLKVSYLEFDNQNEKFSINVFGAVGLSAEYRQIMMNLRYYRSITDPYRVAPFYSPYFKPKGTDSYFTLSVSYFFDEK